jgi:hypothetical protein
MHTLVETPEFIATAKKLLSQQELENLRLTLARHPETGIVMQGTGGFRKLRLAREGGGKSGGYRVIYYYHSVNLPVFLFTAYAKNVKDTLTSAEQNALKQLANKLSQYGQ